jgi:hypothetical protein
VQAGVHFNAHVRLEFNIPGVTFGGRYDGSPVIPDDGTPTPADDANVYTASAKPGGRPPHVWLADGRSLFDTFGRDWTLLVLQPRTREVSAWQAQASQRGLDLQVVEMHNPDLLALYGAPLVLIRPDQVVAWRGDSEASPATVWPLLLG